MNKASKFGIIVISQIVLLAGCAHTDVVLRPERTTFIPVRADMPIVKISGTDELKLRCLDWKGKTDASEAEQCLYFSTDEQEIFGKFSALSTTENGNAMRSKRNIYTSFLINLSDQNCSTFLARAFANKSSFDTGRNIMQDVLTGSTAAAASASPPAAAGMSLANLVIGKSVDNINSTFYFEKTFQSLAAAIAWQRELVLDEIEAMKAQPYDVRPIYDILAAVRKYDDACSIRVGLAKLQELAQEAKQSKKENLKAKSDTAEDKKTISELTAQLESNRKLAADASVPKAQSGSTAKMRIVNTKAPEALLPTQRTTMSRPAALSKKSNKQATESTDLKAPPT